MKKLMVIVILAAVGGLSACAHVDRAAELNADIRRASLNEAYQYGEDIHHSLAKNGQEKTLAAAQAATRRELKDPESANFRSLRISNYEGLEVVCGEVNAKNSYGGYVGYKRFVAGTSGATLYDTDSRYPYVTDAENAGINAACGYGSR